MSYELMSASERQFMPPAVAVSTVAFALRPPDEALTADRDALGSHGHDDRAVTLWIPLVRRSRAPFEGSWALPGGPIPWHEALPDTALRAAHSAVRREPGYLEQLYTFGAIERSASAQRLVTVAYWALYGEHDLRHAPSLPEAGNRRRGEDARASQPGRWDEPASPPLAQEYAEDLTTPDPNVAWFSADRLPDLAFDHADIVAYALWRLRRKTEYSTVAYRFLGSTFTLAQLRHVHEAILGESVDPANFRRQALSQGYLVDTGQTETGTRHRPARLYRFRAEPDPELRSEP